MKVDEIGAKMAKVAENMKLDEIERLIKETKSNFYAHLFHGDSEKAQECHERLSDLRAQREEIKENQMNKFAEEYARLSQRIDGALNDAEMSMAIYDDLAARRSALIVESAYDIKIGVHSVPGGHVVVSPIPGGIDIVYHGDLK